MINFCERDPALPGLSSYLVRPIHPPASLPVRCSGHSGGMPGGAFLIRDSWGTQKETAASGGRGHAAGCAVLLNVAVSDLAFLNFLQINLIGLVALPALQGLTGYRVGSSSGGWRPTHQPLLVGHRQLPDLLFLQKNKR